MEHRTPLLIAAKHGSVDFVKLILSLAEVDVNLFCGPDKSNALHFVASGGSIRVVEVIRLFLLVGALVDWYYNCCRVKNGHCIFDCVPYMKTSLWNTRIIGYTQNKHDDNTLMLFIEMKIVNEDRKSTRLNSSHRP